MSVLKNLRNLSEMEFYKQAIEIRKSLTAWLLRDFGYKKNPRTLKQVVKGIDEPDRKTINDIYEKYGFNPNKTFQTEYPEWFVDFERQVIMEILQELVANITSANSIFATRDFEFDLRRSYQDKAIICCFKLYQELQYIVSIFGTDLNKFVPMLDAVEREVELLKGWRRADNKTRKQYEAMQQNKP